MGYDDSKLSFEYNIDTQAAEGYPVGSDTTYLR